MRHETASLVTAVMLREGPRREKWMRSVPLRHHQEKRKSATAPTSAPAPGQSPGSPLFTRTGGRQWRAPCRLNPTLAGGAHDRRPLLHAHIVVARCDVGDRAPRSIPISFRDDFARLPPPPPDRACPAPPFPPPSA